MNAAMDLPPNWNVSLEDELRKVIQNAILEEFADDFKKPVSKAVLEELEKKIDRELFKRQKGLYVPN